MIAVKVGQSEASAGGGGGRGGKIETVLLLKLEHNATNLRKKNEQLT